ncbi:MAG: HNH endonuclease [Gammaproteobacteria bacterium]|nr:HNH endonuclease [Gammaproteobacteria bacterium]
MPNAGDKVKGNTIGKKDNRLYIWKECVDCGKGKWVILTQANPSIHCRSCASRIRWKKSRRPLPMNDGYILIRLEPNDFYYPMVDHRGYVREHRLVVAKSLGRCLHSWEIIHHRNGDKSDNRLENLQIISELGHRQITILEKKIVELEGRIAKLEIGNHRLRIQNH